MFRKTVIAQALFVAFSGAAVNILVSTHGFAQSNATGNIFGQVDSAAGVVVEIENVDTGIKRSVTPDAVGRYQIFSLPPGNYNVNVVRGGVPVQTRRDIEVRLSQGTQVNFVSTENLAKVQIAGQRQTIDVSTAGSTTIFTAKELEKIPVARSVGGIIQLAPNTTRGDSRYGGANAPSFGGSSASENAYYINGFPVTNVLYQVGFSQLPFNGISQAQVLTGGYGAEFGRSTGGVVNIVTKSGTNDWMGGGAVIWTPDSLRGTPKNQYYGNTGSNPNTDNKIYFYNQDNKRTDYTYDLYIGGPLIKDKLFVYLEGELNRQDRSEIRTSFSPADTTAASSGWQDRVVKIPRYLAKIDWNITDNHHLEYTGLGDKYKDNRIYSGFDYSTSQRNGIPGGGVNYVNWGPTAVNSQQGAEVSVLKYTGAITDDLTITAVLGRTKTPHQLSPIGYDPSVARVADAGDGFVPGITYNNLQSTNSVLVPGAYDRQKGYRLDVEYKLFDSHVVRLGVDYIKIKSLAGTATSGPGSYFWNYARTTPGELVDFSDNLTPGQGGGFGSDGYYVSQVFSSANTTPSVEQAAQYIEDKWQVTQRILVTAGLRNEQFTNFNGDGAAYVSQRHQLAPRLGVAWDLLGDSSFKIYGTAGRYHVQIPTNVAIRAAGPSLNAQQDYTYTGVDPVTGAPLGLTALGPLYSSNNEFGQSKDPRQVAIKNLKGNFQDELTLGMEQALMPGLNYGVKLTYRKLKSVIDDFCDDRAIKAKAIEIGLDPEKVKNFAFQCALFNPGEAGTLTVDVDGDGVLDTIPMSAQELGFPKPKRTYLALDTFAEHPFDGTWYGKINYTYSKNKGNTEGQLLSDIGQADVSTTQAFDFPEFSINANGLLPNDRKHQFKAFGYYQVTNEWGFGANGILASGRPKNCIGKAPDSIGGDYAGYGSAYFFCDDQPSPRGSRGRLPWDARLDLSAAYQPQYVLGLTLKLDIFNVFNRQAAEAIEERYNAGASSLVRTTYGRVVSYTEPISARITLAYDKKF